MRESELENTSPVSEVGRKCHHLAHALTAPKGVIMGVYAPK